MAKISLGARRWAAVAKDRGHEVRTTRNGHPFALIRKGSRRRTSGGVAERRAKGQMR